MRLTFGFRDYFIAIVPAVLQCVIAFTILRRRYYRAIPLFTVYTTFQVAMTAISVVVMASHVTLQTYFYFFYAFEICGISLGFCLIYEIFTSVLKPYDALNGVAKRLLFAIVFYLIIIGMILARYGSGSAIDRVSEVIFVSLRTLRLIQAGVLLALFFLVRSFGLTWRSYIFGIAMGYGIYAILDLILALERTYYGNSTEGMQSLFRTVAYMIMVGIWTCYFVQKDRVAQPVRVIPYNDIAKWNEKLEELLKKKAA
jgi:hypothetical protein